MPADLDVVLAERQFFTGGDADLGFDEIDSGDHLRRRVLHLEASVHFQVVEAAVFVQELDSSRVDVVAATGDFDSRFAHCCDDVGVDVGSGRLLDEFLVPALHRAVAGSEVDAVAVPVGQDLDFHMARFGEVALHVALVSPEVCESLALSGPELFSGLRGAAHDLHAASAAAVCRLDGNRPALGVPEINDLGGVGDYLGGPGDAVHADPLGGLPCRDLVAHHLDRFGVRPDEGHSALGYGAREVGVLGEESVTGMYRICTAPFDGVEDRLGVEVGLSGGPSSQAVGLIGEAHVQRVVVEVGVDRHSSYGEFAAAANDPNRDFTTVCYKYFGKHRVMVSRMSHEVATSSGDLFAASSRVADAMDLGPLRHVEVTGSTNLDLAAEARAGSVSPAVLVADHQSAGRGRLGRQWDDEPYKALLVSIRLPLDRVVASPDRVAGVVAAVGAAARRAADQLTTSTVLTKWPNDLVVEDGPAPGKLGGILAEYIAAPAESVVVGVGINLGAIKLQPGATSMAATSMAECGMVQRGSLEDRDLLLSSLLAELASRLADPTSVLEELRNNSATLGTRVRVELAADRFVVGEATGLSDEGHLLVRCDDATNMTITTGDVIHLRPDP